MTLAEQSARRRLWRMQMRAYALAWRDELSPDSESLWLAIEREGQWKHTDRYAEIRRQVNGHARRHNDSEALRAAIRCRNRSLGRSAFA